MRQPRDGETERKTMMEERLLRIRDLRTTFYTREGEIHAVDGVSIDIDAGESVGIVGESGCGKSMTAMSVMGLLKKPGKVDGGQILFDQQELTSMTAKDRRKILGNQIAMIFQEPMTSLNPVTTVGKQVREALLLHNKGMTREEAKKRVIEAFELVGIPDAQKRYSEYPHQLSGGLRQRVMIAMAMACGPKLLIADEPTTALDVTIQDQILRQLRELEKEYGASIIFITHDLGVVAELCDRVIVMYGGLVMEEASIDDIFERPSHPYTMGLLNSIPDMEQDKAVRLKPIPGSPPDMTNPPAGCPFAPRCPYARKICGAELPEFTQVGEGHHSRCFLLYPDAPADDNNPFRSEV